MSEKPLSTRQRNMLEFIRTYRDENDRPPTIREIGAAVGISSTSVVNYNLKRLEALEYLRRDADVSRGISFTEKAEKLLGIFSETVSGMASAAAENLGLVRIPLAGNIVASEPIDLVNDGFSAYDEDDAIEISASMINGRTGELFALRVDGNSMIDARVYDGDIVVLQQQNTANNGDMVAVWLAGDTTTLKYFYNEGDQIRLQPANPDMEPIYVPPEDVQVQGRVMMVLRQTA
jgi:repressor LexA